MSIIKKSLPIVFVVTILGIVGRMDYDDHIQLERHKCESNQGVWVVKNNGNQYCGGKYDSKY